MLFHVYDDPQPPGYYINEPTGVYLAILNADWIMYILLPLLLLIVVGLLMLGWRVHELPHHKADHKKMRQIELVTALTLLGLFMHWVWAIALFIAYMDWQAAEDWLVGIVRRARQLNADAAAVPQGPTLAAGPANAPADAAEAPSPAGGEGNRP